MPNTDKIPPEYGFLTIFVANFFRWLQEFPPQVFIGNRVDAYKASNFLTQTYVEKKNGAIRRSKRIDRFITSFLVIEIISIFLTSTGIKNNTIVQPLILMFAVCRIIDIVQVNINLTLFDIVRTGKPFNYMASIVRTVINVIINYFEMILCFGLIYCYLAEGLNGGNQWIDAFYYSFILQITLGFEQINPTGFVKIVSAIQLILGFFFTIIILSRFISLLPETKSVVEDGENSPAQKIPDKKLIFDYEGTAKEIPVADEVYSLIQNITKEKEKLSITESDNTVVFKI